MKHKSLFFLCFIFVFSSLVLLNNVGYAHNYFKLRDIGQALGIDVSYDETNGNIIIRTHMDIDKTA